jgi:hypothetical protein
LLRSDWWKLINVSEVLTAEISGNFDQSALLNIPEDGHLHTRRRENLKSQGAITYLFFILALPARRSEPSDGVNINVKCVHEDATTT